MMMFVVWPLLACFQELSAVEWTSAYQNKTEICPGHNVTLGWDYSLEPGETVEDIKWLFATGSGQTSSIIAGYMSGFFISAPAYGNRLSHPSNGKVVVGSVTSADAGTYTTEVFTRQTTGSFSSIRGHRVVAVADPSVYSHNVLSVKMDDQAVAGDDGNLHVRLTCGPIAWRGEPPVDVVWTTPSGAKLNSTGYENDYFYLLVDNPVVGGVYACGLPASAIPALCLRAGDPLTGQAAVTVYSASARLALLEANLQHVKGENLNLRQQLQDVKGDNFNLSQQLQQVTQQLQRETTAQNQCRGQDENDTQCVQLVEDYLHQYRNKSSTRADFHAWLGKNLELTLEDAVKFTRIVYNEGGAYDKSTGQLTAPVDGTYFFVFTTFAYQRRHTANRLLPGGWQRFWPGLGPCSVFRLHQPGHWTRRTSLREGNRSVDEELGVRSAVSL